MLGQYHTAKTLKQPTDLLSFFFPYNSEEHSVKNTTSTAGKISSTPMTVSIIYKF